MKHQTESFKPHPFLNTSADIMSSGCGALPCSKSWLKLPPLQILQIYNCNAAGSADFCRWQADKEYFFSFTKYLFARIHTSIGSHLFSLDFCFLLQWERKQDWFWFLLKWEKKQDWFWFLLQWEKKQDFVCFRERKQDLWWFLLQWQRKHNLLNVEFSFWGKGGGIYYDFAFVSKKETGFILIFASTTGNSIWFASVKEETRFVMIFASVTKETRTIMSFASVKKETLFIMIFAAVRRETWFIKSFASARKKTGFNNIFDSVRRKTWFIKIFASVRKKTGFNNILTQWEGKHDLLRVLLQWERKQELITFWLSEKGNWMCYNFASGRKKNMIFHDFCFC